MVYTESSVQSKITRMSRSVLLICLLTILWATFSGARAESGDRPKSVVLKDRSQQINPFYLKVNNSMDQIWDEFMLVKRANSGDPDAQHELGIRYLTGNGFAHDTARAALWIRKAAEQDLVPARYNYGILLNNGLGVGWNPFEAFKNFRFAAEHGLAEGDDAYGLLLTDNLTVPRNYPEAYRWINMAADSGYKPAAEVLAEFKTRGIKVGKDSQNEPAGSARTEKDSMHTKSGAQSVSAPVHPVFLDFDADSVSEPDDKMLIQDALLENHPRSDSATSSRSSGDVDSLLSPSTQRVLRDAAEAGSPEALTLIGRMYDRGMKVKRDPVTASVYYLRAIRSESPWASLLLWNLSRKDDYFPSLKTHVEQKDPAAFFIWAELADLGFDRQLTGEQAMTFLEQAAELDYPEALVELGIRYYREDHGARDREQAIELLKRAQKLGNREARLRLCVIKLNSEKPAMEDSSVVSVFRQATADGSVLAEAMLGYCYDKGRGVAQNIPEAVDLYRKASQRGSKIAYDALRNLYDELRPTDPAFQVQE